jgi:hypothetical protein
VRCEAKAVRRNLLLPFPSSLSDNDDDQRADTKALLIDGALFPLLLETGDRSDGKGNRTEEDGPEPFA